ncbi:MAG: radical SAM protein [Candidatus Bathyarchaeia archaeon]
MGSEVTRGFKAMQTILNAGAVRSLMRYAVETCENCGKRPIDMYLDGFIGIKSKKCWKCAAVLAVIRGATGITMKSFGKDNSSIKDVASKPYWRKGITSLVRGIAHFGPSKPFTTGAPLMIVWNFTNKCNLRCQHCYLDAGALGEHMQSKDELTTAEALRVVDELADADITSLSFAGGEPLSRKDFFQVAERAHERGMFVSIATNGTLITREVAKKLAKIIGYAEVSLDGVEPETHDSFRGQKGAWALTVAGIKNCIGEGIHTAVATTATRNNFQELPRIVDWAAENKVGTFLSFNFIPTGRGKEITEKDLTAEEREEHLKYLYRKMVEFMDNGGPSVFTTAPQFGRVGIQQSKLVMQEMTAGCAAIPATHYGNLPGITEDLADFIGGCGAGRVYASISPEGIVSPCVFLPVPLGNLRDERFTDIWMKSRVFHNLRTRETLVGRCGKCEFKYVCGGCRARAYGYFGDYLYPDPGCARQFEFPEEDNNPGILPVGEYAGEIKLETLPVVK